MAAETNTLKKDWRRLIWITAGLLTVLVAWNIYHGRKSYRAYAASAISAKRTRPTGPRVLR